MKREDAIAYIRARAAEYFSKTRSGKSFICPICKSGSGPKGTGITTKDGVHFTCWTGCFSNADIFDIVGKIENCGDNFNDKLSAAARAFGVSIDCNNNSFYQEEKRYKSAQKQQNPKQTEKPVNKEEYYKSCMANLDKSSYLQERGISLDVARRFKLGYDLFFTQGTGGTPWNVLIIPTSSYSFVARNISKTENSGMRYRKVGNVNLFNLDALYSGQQVFIVEGEIDALSIIEAGYEAVGLGSTSNVDKLIGVINTNRPKNKLLLAMDHDEKGIEAAEKLKIKLAEMSVPYYEVDISGECKDANEALVKDRKSFENMLYRATHYEEELLEQEKKNYKDTFADARFMDFFSRIEQTAANDPISTGFKTVDELLDGGLYPGLYAVGAISSLGKTTFCIQLADQIAEASSKLPEGKEGCDVLIFSLEMSDDEIMSKSLSRHTYLKSMELFKHDKFGLSTRGILTGKRWKNYTAPQLDVIHAAANDYYQYASRIKIVVGIGDIGVNEIREVVSKHILMTDRKPVVIVDYLQILAPMLERATDKQNTDKAVLELKKMSRDYNIPVIAISSFNRENYTAPVNMAAFKETGKSLCLAA